MHHVDKYGIGRVVDMALDAVNKDRSRPIHLSFDVDACDPSVAPSTGTPVSIPDSPAVHFRCSLSRQVRGGLTFREAHYIVEAIAETGLLVSFDIMEVNPTLGTSPQAVEETVNIGRSLVRAALGTSCSTHIHGQIFNIALQSRRDSTISR